MPELTDISVIRTLCEKYDFALSKGFGQNFIINPGIIPKNDQYISYITSCSHQTSFSSLR